jgi:hypothetical protein
MQVKRAGLDIDRNLDRVWGVVRRARATQEWSPNKRFTKRPHCIMSAEDDLTLESTNYKVGRERTAEELAALEYRVCLDRDARAAFEEFLG